MLVIKNFNREYLRSGFLIFGLIGILILFSGFKNSLKQVNEIKEIKEANDIAVQSTLYRKLIERVGPEKAQDELFKSGLPFTGQTHLLNHVVGDYLYEKFSTKGLVFCRDYFLSSCYHGFILHAIADGGMEAVFQIFAECQKYGRAISDQCAHGMGHGFLANQGYKNLLGALKTCDEAITTIPNFPAFNCYDGVFMENIWAVHDGSPSPDRWVKKDDLFYPCSDPRIKSKYLKGCWSNQPSLVYQEFQVNIRKIAMDLCNKVENSNNKKMCFDGLARQIHPLSHGDIKEMIDLCGLMPNGTWKNYCLVVNAGAAYSVGDRILPFEICSSLEEKGKPDCYERLWGVMDAYKKPEEDLKKTCEKVSEVEWRKVCQNIF